MRTGLVIPAADRVRRYPVSFVYEGGEWLVLNPSTMVLVPTRLVLCQPSGDAWLVLSWGQTEMSLAGWFYPDPGGGHSRALPSDYWHPAAPARIIVKQGTLGGAAFVCEAARHAPVRPLP